MLAPVGRYGVRGAVWCQGESNTGDPGNYRVLLRGLRSDLRSRFGAQLPLLVVQLANYGHAPTRPGESNWAEMREAQRLAVAEDTRSGLAVAIDIGDRYDIHPANKQEVGRRLARAARHVIYAETALPASGPVPKRVRHDGDAVAISFGDVTDGLVAYGADGPIGFELCGAQPGSCRYASAEIHGEEVILRAANATSATRVRYGWADSPIVTLFDGAGLPAGPFELLIPFDVKK
jgi:sialate O-acetylesterase